MKNKCYRFLIAALCNFIAAVCLIFFTDKNHLTGVLFMILGTTSLGLFVKYKKQTKNE